MPSKNEQKQLLVWESQELRDYCRSLVEKICNGTPLSLKPSKVYEYLIVRGLIDIFHNEEEFMKVKKRTLNDYGYIDNLIEYLKDAGEIDSSSGKTEIVPKFD